MNELSDNQHNISPAIIKIDYVPFVNFAMQQNAVPLLRSLTVENNADMPWTDLRIRIWSDPPVFSEKCFSIDVVAVHSTYTLEDLSLTLLREPLRKQTEREEGHLWIEATIDNQSVFRKAYPLSMLAYNEWYGVSTLPEIIAAHVLPNDPAVERILSEASKILLEQTKDGSISGYQSNDPRRVYSQAAAIYWAATQQKIGYVNPPASFEETGQKIRTPEHILDRKLGTCMDTTALLAACFEQAGLNPTIILVKGHSFPGVWLVDRSFDEPATRHASLLLNRIALGEFLIVESTAITKTPPQNFKSAQEIAQINLQNDTNFLYAIDVRSARKIGIRPLSLTEQISPYINEESVTDDSSPNSSSMTDDFEASTAIPTPDATHSDQTTRQDESAADRLNRWKTSLLDLSYRNRLLNFKDSKKSIPLLCPNIAALEDAIANDEEFRVLQKPESWGESDPRNATLHRELHGEDAFAEYLREEMRQRRLHSAVAERELSARLTEIERSARLGLEEGGANTLFLALGFLVYTESETSEIEHSAPILLIPMSIERKSMREGFRIRRIDEESRINVTLLEKLRVDFGIAIEGLDPLPEDDSGLNVPKILHKIRDAIKREPRWKVVEDASISILTFSRFLMWLDLTSNATTLKENAIVRHLVETSNEPFDPGAVYPDIDTLDDSYPPDRTFCPLPADSSQLQAVFAAEKGCTFVLQGPPGTGKSQTITNLIAHCLTNGKRVLFVAQKRAALDVVHKRLTDIGLGPFCMELHSNKTTKESFRSQLRDALNVAASASDETWATETNRLAELRKELNAYANDLHRPRSFGKSPYWIISQLIGKKHLPNVPIDLGNANVRTAEEYTQMQSAILEVTEAAKALGSPASHPLSSIRLTNWRYGIEDDAQKVVEELLQAYLTLRQVSAALLPDLGLNPDRTSLVELRLADALAGLLAQAPYITSKILTEPDWPQTKSKLMEWIELGRSCATCKAKLLETYSEKLLSLDLQLLIKTMHERQDTWFYKKWRLGAAVRKTIKAVRSDGKKPTDLSALEQDLGLASTVIADAATLDESNNLPSQLFGTAWEGHKSKWPQLLQRIEWVDSYRPLLDQAPGNNFDEKMHMRNCWVRLAAEGKALFCSGSAGAHTTNLFRNALKEADEKKTRLTNLLMLDEEIAWGKETSEGIFDRVQSTLKNLSAKMSNLREWSHYQSARATAVHLHLTGLIDALERGEIIHHNLEDIFQRSFAEWWARTVIRTIPSLAGFIGERHNLKIDAFRELEARIADLTKKEIFARIVCGLPRLALSGQRTPPSSEAGILQRFAQGGRKTIRRIFGECSNALARYKPCVLMSPLSVAQFIGADFPKFDLVVFDEASQMPTYEAIGAIARGNQLIVVGDSRQLPPTIFFERQRGDEEYAEDDLPEELESILEEAEAAGVKRLHLDWHYRSRHESLIAFSNRQYYENRLLTFPAAIAQHPRLGVHWREIADGVYDYGKSRTNRKEAEAVVSEIVHRLLDPNQQGNSIGVVTFSMTQQRLVEDLLDAARGEHPEIEPYFSNVDEPVFVKNLETVQGDERDVILFSICYGPDASGVIRMNFGPLNNKGGERRLNVAITRARKQLIVFSTIRPEHINVSRTSAIGVHHLRTFLDYAKRGNAALVEESSSIQGETESLFEQSVYDELTKRGWNVDCQVGCSGYRIDLAIKSPDSPGRYLLGVECDGANYHSAKSARDRDRLRRHILEGLGWTLHRIWSADWWLQRPKEIDKLEEAIKRAEKSIKTMNDIDLIAPGNIPTKTTSIEGEGSSTQTKEIPLIAHSVKNEKPDFTKPEPLLEILPGQTVYQRYTQSDKSFAGELHDRANAALVCDLVFAIAQIEAPILIDTLCAEVAAYWELQRTGTRIRNAVYQAVKKCALIERKTGSRQFLWTQKLDKQPYTVFRVPDDNDPNPRMAQEICPEEIANAAAQVLAQHISMNSEDLIRETANIFGIKRIGQNVRTSIEDGLALLKIQGRCKLDGVNLVADGKNRT